MSAPKDTREYLRREFAEITARKLLDLAERLKGDDQQTALDADLAIRALLAKRDASQP